MDQCIEMLHDLVPAIDKGLGVTINPPFGAYIMLESLTKHFKMLWLEVYDGSTNSVDHMESFKS